MAVRGEGVWLYHADGNCDLDAYNNVPAVGHSQQLRLFAIPRRGRARGGRCGAEPVAKCFDNGWQPADLIDEFCEGDT